jgi:hypothetical protein
MRSPWRSVLVAFFLSIAALAGGSAHAPGFGKPVLHTPARNQRSVGFCWAYTTMGWLESEIMRAHGRTQLSPEYLGLYTMYFRIQEHLRHYRLVAGRMSGRLPVTQATMKSRCVTVEKEDPVKCHARHIYRDADYYTPGEGAYVSSVLWLLPIIGVVPNRVFSLKIDDAEEERLQSAIAEFIRTRVLDDERLDAYLEQGPDGINHALLKDFRDALGVDLPLPGQKFQYQGRTYTPRTFYAAIQERTGFEPEDYREIEVKLSNHQAAMEAVRAQLMTGHAVPLGTGIFQDDLESGGNLWDLSNREGMFTSALCKKRSCADYRGGHEMLAVNWHNDAQGEVDGFVLKNSWGHKGRNAQGARGESSSERGFFLIDKDYLASSIRTGWERWVVILPKAVADRIDIK